MKYLLLIAVFIGTCVFMSCVKPTSSDEYNWDWQPYSKTSWFGSDGRTELSGIAAENGGFSYKATISNSNIVDTLGLLITTFPSMHVISNIESGSSAQLSIFATISSKPDSMLLSTVQVDPVTHDTSKYAYFQFGKVRGIIRTAGKDSVFTQPRAFASNILYSYQPSINPDSCSKRFKVQLIVNWNAYTGASVIDTMKTTTVTVQIKNMAFSVRGIDILK